VSRRLLLPAAVLLALALPAPASAIVHGTPAEQGEYPAQGFLGIDSDGNGFVNSFCSGTLVGSRQFLTAARCTTNGLGQARPATSFTVQIGDIALPDSTVVQNVAANDIPDPTEIPPDGYVRPTGENDIAMLTLKAPVDANPVRVVDSSETAAWAPGTAGRVLGWGEIAQAGDISETLLTGDVAVRPDADCPNVAFNAAVMLCAASTVAGGDGNPCASDSGSPLLVPDGPGPGFVLAGVFSGASCATSDAPGIFARVGADPLNAWVHDRTPEADFTFNHAPRANEPVTLMSISRHPEGASYYTVFKWDFDDDGVFETPSPTKNVTHTFTTAGEEVVGIQVSKPGGDTASAYFAFDVGPDPNVVPPGSSEPPGAAPPPPPTTVKRAAPRLASISAAKRPKVRRGHFRIRVKFARTAPRGTAVIEVLRGKRKIGIARTRVRRGATKRVNVKLTTTGQRLLRRSATKRLKVAVRVRVGRTALRSKTLTLQR
jgi:hypothetical protein